MLVMRHMMVVKPQNVLEATSANHKIVLKNITIYLKISGHPLELIPNDNSHCKSSPLDRMGGQFLHDLPKYYTDLKDPAISTSFRNLDDERSFELYDREIRNPNTQNFTIDFGEDDAFCAFDLEAESVLRLVHAPRPPNLHTRWINIWIPYQQKETLHTLARYYDFSPRLLALMCSNPVPPKANSLASPASSSTLKSRRTNKSERSTKSSKRTTLDSEEESIGMTSMMESAQMEGVRDLGHYHVVDDVWHWSSVDWGRRCKSSLPKYYRNSMYVGVGSDSAIPTILILYCK